MRFRVRKGGRGSDDVWCDQIPNTAFRSCTCKASFSPVPFIVSPPTSSGYCKHVIFGFRSMSQGRKSDRRTKRKSDNFSDQVATRASASAVERNRPNQQR